ncbi:hypothetical protein UlMin_019357 [Ulmus minor]
MFPALFKGLDIQTFQCDVCQFAKHKRVSFPTRNKRCSKPFHLIHSDIWGPSRVPNISGAKWFVSFIDDCTRVTWVYLLKQKSDVSAVFPIFHTMIQNQFGVKIKRFRSDNALDYFNQTLSPYFLKEGIIHESSCVYTPQQNGVAERKNGHILDTTRALLFQNSVPKSYWGEAVLTSIYLINRLVTPVLDSQSPISLLTQFFPNFNTSSSISPRVFGCTSFVHIHSSLRSKLDPKAIKCIFIGYSSTQKGYKCYHPSTQKFYVSADVTFHETRPFYTKPYLQGESLLEDKLDASLDFNPLDLPASVPGVSASPTSITDPETVSVSPETASPTSITDPETVSVSPETVSNQSQNNLNNDATRFSQVYSRRNKSSSMPQQAPSLAPNTGTKVTSHSSDLPIAVRKGTRECTKKPLYPISNFVAFDKFSPSHKSFLVSLNTIPIPTVLSEALSNEKWRQAMQVEMEALEKNRTWEIVDLPKEKKLVGCKWVFTVKYKADGTLERYKARLVAKGYTQTYGIDYQETFAPVAKMNTVRVLLSLAANFNWPLQQFDVKNAFLQGDLEEEIYMRIPPGYGGALGANKACRLRKALYGLKQSPRAWYGRFAKVMLKSGYKQSQGDHTLFIKHSQDGKVTVLLVYVDDIIITGDNEIERERLKECLTKEFDIKELGRLKYFLGIEVAHSQEGIFISQQKYVTDLLTETGKLGCKPAVVPVDPNQKLGEAPEDLAVDREMYQRLVGKLIYLSHTRPDIAYAVSMVSQFMHSPREVHLQAAYQILHYLKGSLVLEAYTDADYAESVVNRRSTSGYCTFIGGNLVTWRSKKQSVVARSSAEAEFRAMALGICELLWLKIILDDLKIKRSGPMRLYCDNKSAISIAHNPVQHDRTKHIEVDRNFIKEKLDSGLVCTPYVSTTEQLADILTKGLSSKVFHGIISKLGMQNTYSPA